MAATSVIGQRLARVDSPQKVRGQTRYSADLNLPGMLYARLATSYQAHARIVSIDTSAAKACPGVVDVLIGKDLLADGPEPSERGRAMLARDKVIYYGQPVAVVLATSEDAAVEAAALVTVEYESLGVNVDPIAAMAKNAPAIRASGQEGGAGDAAAHATVSGGQELDTSNLGPNVTNALAFKRGDVAKGFAEADVVIEHTYITPSVHQGYIEPHATTAVPDPLGNLTIYTTTQGQFYTRNATADTLGIP
ncbi:MAG TPA: molybdopterin cofactor-binding domain-containing protein, partial [Nitrolancea sp.]